MRHLLIAIAVVVQVLLLLFGVLPYLRETRGAEVVMVALLLSLVVLVAVLPEERI
jgi:hypothetical protein